MVLHLAFILHQISVAITHIKLNSKCWEKCHSLAHGFQLLYKAHNDKPCVNIWIYEYKGATEHLHCQKRQLHRVSICYRVCVYNCRALLTKALPADCPLGPGKTLKPGWIKHLPASQSNAAQQSRSLVFGNEPRDDFPLPCLPTSATKSDHSSLPNHPLKLSRRVC